MASATRRPPPTSIITTCGVPRALGEVFGVAGERDAGVVDHALLHRRGDHGVELAGEAAVDARGRAARARSGALRRIELARRDAGRAQRHVLDCAATRARSERAVADDDHARRAGSAREERAQLGTDAGGLAGGERDDRRALALVKPQLDVGAVAQLAQPVLVRLVGLALAHRLARLQALPAPARHRRAALEHLDQVIAERRAGPAG